MLSFVQLDWRALRFATDEVRGDVGIVGAAVHQDNPLGVLENMRALEYASFYLRSDKSFLLWAAEKSERALDYATDVVLSDKDFIKKASMRNWRCLDYAGNNLKQSREFMLQAVSEGNGGKGIRLNQIPQHVEFH